MVTYTGEGAYPGQDVLLSFALTPCLEAFETYVGSAFQTSNLDMFIVTPSDQTWVKGHRDFACVVLTVDGHHAHDVRRRLRP